MRQIERPSRASEIGSLTIGIIPHPTRRGGCGAHAFELLSSYLGAFVPLCLCAFVVKSVFRKTKDWELPPRHGDTKKKGGLEVE